MFEEYVKHLRQKPAGRRLTVKTECAASGRSFS